MLFASLTALNLRGRRVVCSVIVRTESGTAYEIDGMRVRRIPDGDDGEMRRDGEWLDIVGDEPVVEVGKQMRLYLEPLGKGIMTLRITSRVVEVEE